jgi:tripartite-type tricarboxylate transporter receptor subunit TctC
MPLLHKMLRILLCAALAPALHVAPARAAADFPSQPIHIVVPWTAGGFTDVLGRMIAEKMTRSLGQPVVVDNKPGASGGIGSEYVSRAAPDGYTLLLTTSDALVYNVNVAESHALNPAANAKPPYDAIRDFTQVTLMGTQPVLFAVGGDVPARNVAEFVAMAKAKPGAVSYGSSGEGSAVHLAMEMFSTAAGIKMIHVPYKGINPALMDVLGGQVQALFISVQGAGGNLKTGKLRALAITSTSRSPLVPDVPTMAEAGYPNFQLTLWYGLAGPKGMPQDVVDKLNEAAKAALASPDVREKLVSGNTQPIGSTQEEARAFLASETAKWSQAVRASKGAQ